MSKKIILIPHEVGTNIYLKELGHAYEKSGAIVISGRENFLYFNCRPDIIHAHWPEQLCRIDSLQHNTEMERTQYALEKLRYFKQQGAKCVLTIHNLVPHEGGENEASRLVCQGFYDAADLIVHHCEKSVELAKSVYVGAGSKKTVVHPHGHYLAYPSEMTRQEARRKLGLLDNDFVFLHFGLIRGYKGVQNALNCFYKAKVKNKKLIIAGMAMDWASLKGNIFERVNKKIWEKRGRLIWHLKRIQNDEVQLYFKACDATVLGHSSGLNSGVAILGMTFGKVVVGPDLGCIGEVLRSGENVVYDPKNPDGLVKALEQAAYMDLLKAGEKNRVVAETWSWDEMATSILDMVQNL